MTTGTPLRAAIFASGGGSNLQALLDDAAHGRSWLPALLVTDRPDAGAIERAEDASVPVRVIPTQGRAVEEVESETLRELAAHSIDLIFLAGYLKLVPAGVVHHFSGRIVNVHPALLPAFGGQGMYGMNVHRAVLEAGARITGPTVHLVDEEYDRGRILAQWPVPVRAGDTPQDIAARVLIAEHRLYPLVAEEVASALADGRPVAPLDRGYTAFEGVSGDPSASK